MPPASGDTTYDIQKPRGIHLQAKNLPRGHTSLFSKPSPSCHHKFTIHTPPHSFIITTTVTITWQSPNLSSDLILRPSLKMRTPNPCLCSSSPSSPSSSYSPLLTPHIRPSSFSFSSSPSPSSFLHSFRFRRFHVLKPCSSLKQTKKQTLQKPSSIPQSLRFESPKNGDDDDDKKRPADDDGGEFEGDTAIKGTILAGLLLVGVVGGFASVGYIYKDQINAFLTQLSGFIEGYGTAGYALFVVVYAGLEVLAIPAIPLTMSAGLLFGSVTGTIIVSISGTVAATVAFLIARYFARERILKLVEGNKKFLAIDKAIGENGFRVVTLLRLSPLLPFSIGNYLYGLTSVKLIPYVLGSWLGMLPGSWAYVSAGAFGRAIIQEESEMGLPGGNGQLWMLGLGLLATALAAAYVTRLAKDAVKDIE